MAVVLVSVGGELWFQGYWNAPDNLPKSQVLDWSKGRVESIGLLDLRDTLYSLQAAEFRSWEMLTRGICSLLVEPVLLARDQKVKEIGTTKGFIFLASSIEYAYSDKDRVWIKAMANKFVGENT